MTTYSENFAGMTTGSAPTNFTTRFTTTSQTWTVEDPADGEGEADRVFRYIHTANATRLFSFDDVDSDTERQDSEIVIRWRINDADADIGMTLWVNGSGGAGTEDGYFIEYNLNIVTPRWRLKRFDAGTKTTLVTVNWPRTHPFLEVVPIIGKWYYNRFRKNGTALQFRTWAADEAEPSTWLIDTTDSDLDVDGWVGVGCGNQDGFEVDYVGVGTAGDTAPIDVSTTTQLRLTAAYAAVLQTGTPNIRLTAAYAAVLYAIAPPPPPTPPTQNPGGGVLFPEEPRTESSSQEAGQDPRGGGGGGGPGNAGGGQVIIDLPPQAGGPFVLDAFIEGYDYGSRFWYTILAGTTITTGGTRQRLVVSTFTADIAGQAANDLLPYHWRVRMEHGDATEVIYSVEYKLF